MKVPRPRFLTTFSFECIGAVVLGQVGSDVLTARSPAPSRVFAVAGAPSCR